MSFDNLLQDYSLQIKSYNPFKHVRMNQSIKVVPSEATHYGNIKAYLNIPREKENLKKFNRKSSLLKYLVNCFE